MCCAEAAEANAKAAMSDLADENKLLREQLAAAKADKLAARAAQLAAQAPAQGASPAS